MKTLRILAAVLALGCSAARAEAILDLSTPQRGPTSSVLDLGDGTGAAWGDIGVEVRATTMAAGATGSGGGGSESGRKTEAGGSMQQASGHVRRDGAAASPAAKPALR